jgi:hypothetical protein
MDQTLFCVTCIVSNGYYSRRYGTHLFAYTSDQAKRAAIQYWKEHNCSVVVENTRIAHVPVGNVIFNQALD